jgi:transposase-like protein
MSNERKYHAPGEKVAILRRHLIDRVPVSTLCDEHRAHPTVFYRWLKQFIENGAAAFGPAPRADKQAEARAARRLPARQAEEEGRGAGGADGRARSPKKVLGRSEEPMGTPLQT